MGIRSTLRWVFAVGVLAYAASPAGAQPAPSAPPAPAGAAGAGPTSSPTPPPGGDAQVGFQRKTSLTPQEQLVESSKHLTRMEQAAVSVRKMLEEARRQRDVVRTLCLNDKLSQIDVAIRSARDRKGELQSAVNRNDNELANHQFTILTVLRQRVEQLIAEANQCIGEEAAFLGDTRTKMSVDPSIPEDEAPYPATDPAAVVGIPQCTSCTL